MRKCESCIECCRVLAVAEIGKPKDTPCEKLCKTGCSIYEARPSSCRSFECLWLGGLLDESARPDKLGLMFTKGKRLPQNGGDVIVAHELREEADQPPEASRAIGLLLSRGKSVVLVRGNTRKFLPSSAVAASAFRSVVDSNGGRS